MPLEIGLLEINTQVDQEDDERTSGMTEEVKEEIVMDCIEKVLQVLKDREEL